MKYFLLAICCLMFCGCEIPPEDFGPPEVPYPIVDYPPQRPWVIPNPTPVGEFPIPSSQFALQYAAAKEVDLRPIEREYLNKRVCWAGTVVSKVPSYAMVTLKIGEGAELCIHFDKKTGAYPEWVQVGDRVAVTGMVSIVTLLSVHIDPESFAKVN